MNITKYNVCLANFLKYTFASKNEVLELSEHSIPVFLWYVVYGLQP